MLNYHVIAVTKPSKIQEVVAKRLSAEICKAFPKDEAVSSLEALCQFVT